jgi:hypothetical protein
MDWNKILETVILVLVPILIPALVAYLLAQARKAWAQAKEAQPDLTYYLEQAASFAVAAAEQLKLAGIINDKKAYALQIAEEYLVAKDVTIDLHLIDAAIEAAVWQELNQAKLPIQE